MTRLRRAVALFSLLVSPCAVLAPHTELPPVHPLGRVVARLSDADTLGYAYGVRTLSDGRVLIDDIKRRRIILLDSTLGRMRAIMDTSGSATRGYPRMPGSIYRGQGDSTLFVDPIALAFVVLDPDGKVTRVMGVPRPGDASLLEGLKLEGGIDIRGRLVYRGSGALVPAPPGDYRTAVPSDSAPILRADLATHVLDTVAFIRVPKSYPSVVETDSDGTRWFYPTVNPLAVGDDWGLLDDGTVAILRARDDHVDWISPDGARTATPKLPHDWQRLSDSAKAAIVDSQTKDYTANPRGTMQAVAPNGATRTRPRILRAPSPADLPDYPPPFVVGSALVDAEGNLWIEERARGLVYDLVNRKGELFDRVEIPGGTTIEGFAPGSVYLSSNEGTHESLVRVRIR